MKSTMQEKAANYFAKGYNCCQSVLLAANDLWALEISPDVIASAHFFREGMGAGCTCGALVGCEMALGIIQQRKGVSLKAKPACQLHDNFVKAFGSSCCRVLRKKQGVLERATNQGCKKITAQAAGILYDLFEELKVAMPA
ncbi:C-GCAxxG-C-C family protein [Zhaonella formicivorans]|uniref:C-GCAxxG-C-C family protein n=1 Tax=Zhaonella formicivorans TaxID=2528593 RepID=UPI0010E50305|nr:C-GCAxxG-C-C family protein [Zhaonella formicivorans]